MNEMPSSEFRKRYAGLTEDTVVTVSGHPIGIWQPLSQRPSQISRQNISTEVVAERLMTNATQAARDDLLRKINRSR